MQTANALNNIIRILFNPKIEAFKLFDFLIVKSNENRYLAQITEIYDDKFDSSQNVAKLKIFYKISENNEVMPYDNFTPNKECEIVKIKQQEIENFINLDKETFIFATNAKSQTALNIQYDFFNNNPIILADKVECANTISLNIAKKLSEKKHAIIIDSTGVIEHDCAKKITANKDIKIPLNYSTIDYVFDRCLTNASLEFQATAGAIINEIKNFARKQTLEFIPFNAFLRVILEQYKATPYPELKVLIVKMKKYQMNEIFARYKKDVENLFKTIEKNPVTIIDLSNVDNIWQKAYLEYLTDAIDKEIYLITRINEENSDIDLINKIYNKKKNIGFIPAVSYNYKKLPSLIQYCKNYILMPSLYQRTDFLDANFALSNLISTGCILFGENTDNFLYMAKDYELLAQEKRKNYKKIVLSLIDEDDEEEQPTNETSNQNEDLKTDSQKLIDELSTLEEENNKKIEQQNSSKEEFEEIQNPTPKDAIDEFDEIISKNPKTESLITEDAAEDISENIPEDILHTTEQETIKEDLLETATTNEASKEEIKIQEDKIEEPPVNNTTKDTTEDIIKDTFENIIEEDKETLSLDKISESTEILLKEEVKKEPLEKESTEKEPVNLDFKDILVQEEKEEKKEKQEEKPSDDLIFEDDELIFEGDSPNKKTTEEPKQEIKPEKEQNDDDILDILDKKESKEDNLEIKEDLILDNEKPKSIAENDDLVITNDDTVASEEINFSDEELDFFQLAKESESIQEENSAPKADDIDLSQVATNSLDSSFDDIINTKSNEQPQTIAIDNNTKIDEKILETDTKKENLPIFKEEIKQDPKEHTYTVGEKVSHDNYGIGVVVKILKYENRQLLQIDFEEAGKKTLEPRIANVKPVE